MKNDNFSEILKIVNETTFKSLFNDWNDFFEKRKVGIVEEDTKNPMFVFRFGYLIGNNAIVSLTSSQVKSFFKDSVWNHPKCICDLKSFEHFCSSTMFGRCAILPHICLSEMIKGNWNTMNEVFERSIIDVAYFDCIRNVITYVFLYKKYTKIRKEFIDKFRIFCENRQTVFNLTMRNLELAKVRNLARLDFLMRRI